MQLQTDTVELRNARQSRSAVFHVFAARQAEEEVLIFLQKPGDRAGQGALRAGQSLSGGNVLRTLTPHSSFLLLTFLICIPN